MWVEISAANKEKKEQERQSLPASSLGRCSCPSYPDLYRCVALVKAAKEKAKEEARLAKLEQFNAWMKPFTGGSVTVGDTKWTYTPQPENGDESSVAKL